MKRSLSTLVGLLIACSVAGCGGPAGNKSAAQLAAVLRSNGHDVKAESLIIEQRYADSARSADDKGTMYIVRVESSESAGARAIKGRAVRYKVFVAASDGWTQVSGAFPTEDQAIAEIQMANFASAVQQYKAVHKKLPTTLQDLAKKTAQNSKPFIDSIPKDPWDNSYEYRPNGNKDFTIRSHGEDRRPDTEDDVVWPKEDWK